MSLTTVSQIFNTWIKFLSHELKPLIYWPDRSAIQTAFPASLPTRYRNRLRCIIDCTEVFIERPRNLQLQSMTWSDYKKHNTIKFLVAIAPNASISYVSEAWCGRASDRKITVDSELYTRLLERDDIVLADRGFPIRGDFGEIGVALEIPPPSSAIEQMTKEKVLETKRIANVRIHVERSIGQMKQYDILSNILPIALVPLIDDIIVVCAALSNLKDPLVS